VPTLAGEYLERGIEDLLLGISVPRVRGLLGFLMNCLFVHHVTGPVDIV
jgi:hypothetical protein